MSDKEVERKVEKVKKYDERWGDSYLLTLANTIGRWNLYDIYRRGNHDAHYAEIRFVVAMTISIGLVMASLFYPPLHVSSAMFLALALFELSDVTFSRYKARTAAATLVESDKLEKQLEKQLEHTAEAIRQTNDKLKDMNERLDKMARTTKVASKKKVIKVEDGKSREA